MVTFTMGPCLVFGSKVPNLYLKKYSVWIVEILAHSVLFQNSQEIDHFWHFGSKNAKF